MKSSKQFTCGVVRRILLWNSPLSTYFFLSNTTKMPFLAELCAAADTWNRQDGLVSLQECEHGGAEEGIDGDAKAAVACESVVSSVHAGGEKKRVYRIEGRVLCRRTGCPCAAL
jgi:hypothetical protein